MKIIGIIPARMESTRFPGKPLKKIKNKAMIDFVYENATKNQLLDDVYIATCNKEIAEHCKLKNYKFVMTSTKHKRASDRCAEALKKIENLKKIKYKIIVLIQGDEPMLNKNMITEALNPLIKNNKIQISNLIYKLDKDEYINKNVVKVVFDKDLYALYFSRSPIPYTNTKNKIVAYKQIAIIPFRKNFLFKYLRMKETNLEKIESVDMMRVLENGYKVKLVKTKYNTYSVDTLSDLKKVSRLINE